MQYDDEAVSRVRSILQVIYFHYGWRGLITGTIQLPNTFRQDESKHTIGGMGAGITVGL